MAPRIGSENLLKKHGSPLAIAEALIKGELDSYEQMFVSDVVDKILLEAARIRLEASGFFKVKEEA
jgi:hypothetical protein